MFFLYLLQEESVFTCLALILNQIVSPLFSADNVGLHVCILVWENAKRIIATFFFFSRRVTIISDQNVRKLLTF